MKAVYSYQATDWNVVPLWLRQQDVGATTNWLMSWYTNRKLLVPIHQTAHAEFNYNIEPKAEFHIGVFWSQTISAIIHVVSFQDHHADWESGNETTTQWYPRRKLYGVSAIQETDHRKQNTNPTKSSNDTLLKRSHTVSESWGICVWLWNRPYISTEGANSCLPRWKYSPQTVRPHHKFEVCFDTIL